MTKIKNAVSEKDILNCWQAMHHLRPHLQESEFLNLIRLQQKEGYKLAYIEEEEKAVAVVGFRIMNRLFTGRGIYIDDLSTLPDYRGKGYASKLLDYVYEYARQNECKEIHLDSGVGNHRFEAHRLYLNNGYNITSHHFSLKITE